MPSITKIQETKLLGVDVTDKATVELYTRSVFTELTPAEARHAADMLNQAADEIDNYLDDIAQEKHA